MSTRLTTKEFITRSKLIHGIKYTYKKSIYVTSMSKVIITCKDHGDFEQRPNAHLAGRGCSKCKNVSMGNRTRSSTSEFIEKSKAIHGIKYSYNQSHYVSAIKKVVITCKRHGDFSMTPNDHLNGQNCPKCSQESKIQKLSKDNANFIKEATKVHKDAYKFSKCCYKNSYTKVTITCKDHGDFDINPRMLLRGSGCPECKSTRASQIAILWINDKARSLRLKNVQHLKSGGEYNIPGTKYRVDGYHAPTKTVFEFHGDRWHGNPKVYKPTDKCHPYSDKTAKELYKDTIARENHIKSLGYRLFVMWEYDYRKLVGI